MRRKLAFLVGAVALAIAGAAAAQALDDKKAAEAMKKAGCDACHSVDRKGVGPSYKDVAAKSKGKADAVAKLAEKVKKGGSGVWGPVPMAPNPAVPDADIKVLVEWVLKQG